MSGTLFPFPVKDLVSSVWGGPLFHMVPCGTCGISPKHVLIASHPEHALESAFGPSVGGSSEIRAKRFCMDRKRESTRFRKSGTSRK